MIGQEQLSPSAVPGTTAPNQEVLGLDGATPFLAEAPPQEPEMNELQREQAYLRDIEALLYQVFPESGTIQSYSYEAIDSSGAVVLDSEEAGLRITSEGIYGGGHAESFRAIPSGTGQGVALEILQSSPTVDSLGSSSIARSISQIVSENFVSTTLYLDQDTENSLATPEGALAALGARPDGALLVQENERAFFQIPPTYQRIAVSTQSGEVIIVEAGDALSAQAASQAEFSATTYPVAVYARNASGEESLRVFQIDWVESNGRWSPRPSQEQGSAVIDAVSRSIFQDRTGTIPSF